jgi:sulfate/thiosulfate transport system substrate-binding protein
MSVCGKSTLGLIALTGLALVLGLSAGCNGGGQGDVELLNVSYDPTRELWRDLNDYFIKKYEKETGKKVVINQSHGGSSSQARAVIDGQDADVVTLALWSDTDAIRAKGLIKDGWEERLPNHSLPYYSTIVFVVRKGNPKGVHDWPDLVEKDGVEVITPNPKTSGNGRLSFLAAWGSVLNRKGHKGTEDEAREFVTKLYKRVPVLDSGARGSTTTFAQNKKGDVHLTWENEAALEVAESKGELEVIYPSASIKAEPYVAVVDEYVDRHGTRAVAEAYLKSVYDKEAQEIIAKHGYRPTDAEVFARHKDELPDIPLFEIKTIVKDWGEAQTKFFADGGVFDKIYVPGK